MKTAVMKRLILSLLLMLVFLSGKSQQLFYLHDIPANPNFGVALQDSHLFVIKNFGVSAFNISQPVSPVFISSVTPQYWPLTLYADGDYLYCGGGMVGQLAVLDISQPATMTIVHQDPGVTGTVYQFAKSIQHLYFTSNQDTLFTADISNATTPVITSRISLNQTFTEGAATAGNRLFLGSTGGILVYDLTNPAQPVYQSSYPGNFRKLSYNQQDQQLYTLNANGDIAVYNATNLNALAFQYSIPADASNFTAVGKRLAILTNGGGVTLMEAGSTSANILGTFNTPAPGGQQNAIAMQDSIIAYTTVNSTYLLKYGFVNPQGIPETSSYQNGWISFCFTDESLKWNTPEELKQLIQNTRIFDATGGEVFRSNNTAPCKMNTGSLPLAYQIELKNGHVIHGRIALER